MRLREPGWKAQRAKGIELLQADPLAKIPWLVHGFSTRIGFAKWDTPEAVAANRRKLAEAVGAPRMALASLRQIHSDVAHIICAPPHADRSSAGKSASIRTGSAAATRAASPSSSRAGSPSSSGADSTPTAGDAAITRDPGVLLSVQTADCVPILLVDTKHRVVAAVHAGWRGTLARIAVKTLGRMQQEFGTRPQDIVAALGPAIGQCCYEVGPEVARNFAAKFADAADWFNGQFAPQAEGEAQHWLPWLTMMPPGHQPEPERARLDLRASNRAQLIELGVPGKQIAMSTLCTRCRADLFFSYRREGAGTGRLMAVIGICEAATKRAARARPVKSKRSAKTKSKRAIR